MSEGRGWSVLHLGQERDSSGWVSLQLGHDLSGGGVEDVVYCIRDKNDATLSLESDGALDAQRGAKRVFLPSMQREFREATVIVRTDVCRDMARATPEAAPLSARPLVVPACMIA